VSRATSGGARRGRELVAHLDLWADRRLEPLRGNRLADRLFYTASEAGNFSVIWHIAAWLPCLVRPSRAQLRRSIRTSAALALESVVVNGGVKSLFGRARPSIERSNAPHRLRRPQTSSFPSGHASSAMVAAAMLSHSRSRRVSVAAYSAAGVVSVSRIYVRIHHASDVVGGLALGAVFGMLLRRLPP
jgi:undecaprenyl-diphosphatase